ncbi:hypothetical protein [Planomonospora parontospora]|uniref:hypothetical protein n=1 Tax=Planomonospora parontospora TaxID=58119 RepID=UPI0019415993|nr:hypothetical protein [Planomonospora parontospora]GGL51245.1 hypothetical protein GCM10014719_60660 [Planomonospora parontospora subsp. antibiotica]GII19083.1 hypothetical protein Ppa05_58090 [Planomonospora parontospora subsp. antibiotica]
MDRIRADLDLTATGVALLTTVPTLAMGVCAPLAALGKLGARDRTQAAVLAYELGLVFAGVRRPVPETGGWS